MRSGKKNCCENLFRTHDKRLEPGGPGMESQQQFCLKWNSFGSNLATAFSNLFKSESLADVTLFCEGTTFKAHKLILAACSKHFADLFETAPPTSGSCYVILEATSSANLSALLEFMYKGEVHVSQEALSSFLKAAESLQVKGLSIEHEKLAVAQSQHRVHDNTTVQSPTRLKNKLNNSAGNGKQTLEADNAMAMPHSSSFSPVLSPYIHPIGYGRHFEQRLASNMYESPRKRHLRSPINELHQEGVRGSVLRDGSKAARTSSPSPSGRAYRPGSSSSSGGVAGSGEADNLTNDRGSPTPASQYEGGGDNAAEASNGGVNNNSGGGGNGNKTAFDTTAAVTDEREDERKSGDQGFAEDLSIKMELDFTAVKGSAPPTPSDIPAGGGGMNFKADGGGLPLHVPPADLLNSSLWNASKLTGHKAGSVSTADGKKLKCPYCERLYGYETNLRAHIRQRHQGIRVPCPFCSRTFTRNNTVRRHIAREHKQEMSLKQYQQTQLQNHSQVN